MRCEKRFRWCFVVAGSMLALAPTYSLRGAGEKKASRFAFPERIASSETVLDRDVIRQVNRIETPNEQISFLIRVATAQTDMRRKLSPSQVTAVRLLGLTRATSAVPPLVGLLIHQDKRDGHWPATLALVDLGELSVEGLTSVLTQSKDQQERFTAVRTIQRIKGIAFPQFITSQRGKLPEDAIKLMEFASWLEER